MSPTETQALQEHAADIILTYARECFSACVGSKGQPFACPDCKNPAECRKDHAEIVEVAVKLRGAN